MITIPTSIKIPLNIFEMNPEERFTHPFVRNKYYSTIHQHIPNFALSDKNKLINENVKHIYKHKPNVKISINTTLPVVLTITQHDIPDMENKQIELYNSNHQWECERIKRLDSMRYEISQCNKLLYVIAQCYTNFNIMIDDLITMLPSNKYKNSKKINKNKLIKYLLEGEYKRNFLSFSCGRVKEVMEQHMRNNKNFTFKMNPFGKHQGPIKFTENKCVISSTMMKTQMYDNNYLWQSIQKYVDDNVDKSEKNIYNLILNNIASKSREFVKNDKLIEIFCTNIIVMMLQDEIKKYKIHLEQSIDFLENIKHAVCQNVYTHSNILFGKLTEISDNVGLRNVSFNLDGNRIKYDKIFMLKTPDMFWKGYTLENGKIYEGCGFCVCKAVSNGKYNMFPICDKTKLIDDSKMSYIKSC
jgi:hypothetical protein